MSAPIVKFYQGTEDDLIKYLNSGAFPEGALYFATVKMESDSQDPDRVVMVTRPVGAKYDSPTDLFCVTPVYSMVQNPGAKKNCLQFNEQYKIGNGKERSTEFYVPTEPFSGTDGYIDGKKGLVPAPTKTEQLSFLRGDGTWAVPTMTIADGSITGAKLATNAVTKDKIAYGSITAEKLADSAVTKDKIAVNAVTSTELASNAVTEAELAANAVTNGKLAANAVTESKIAAYSVSEAKLTANAVTATKIKDKAVTAAKLGDDVNTIAIQQTEPTDHRVKIWIQT